MAGGLQARSFEVEERRGAAPDGSGLRCRSFALGTLAGGLASACVGLAVVALLHRDAVGPSHGTAFASAMGPGGAGVVLDRPATKSAQPVPKQARGARHGDAKQDANSAERTVELDLEATGGSVCAAAPGTVFACGSAGILTPQGILTPEMVPARRLRPAKLSINGAPGQTETDVILRTAILDRKVELYKGLWAKVNQCGGNGQCATCIVEVTAGANRLSPKTDFELNKLQGKPASYRLACQTLINGDVDVVVP